jgi:hypothetical protein
VASLTWFCGGRNNPASHVEGALADSSRGWSRQVVRSRPGGRLSPENEDEPELKSFRAMKKMDSPSSAVLP